MRKPVPSNAAHSLAAVLLQLCVALATAGAWAGPIEDLNAGEWYRVPNSKLEAVFPPSPPAGNPRNIMNAWCGGAFDTNRDRLIVWGGGHGDYAGNELYVFDLNTLEWSRLTDPSEAAGGSEASGVYGNGRPRSTHTYNTLTYSPSADLFVFAGMSGIWVTGKRSEHSGGFDFASDDWVSFPNRPSVGLVEKAVTAYDRQTGLIWQQPGATARLISYDLQTQNWQTYPEAKGPQMALGATGAIDPDRRLFVAAGRDQLFIWDLDDPGSYDPPSTSGPTNIIQAKAPGFVYDPVSSKFVGWAGGTSVYTLDPDTWTWQRVDAAGSNSVVPTSPNSNGTFGRFRYSPAKNVFVVVNSTSEDVYIYKLTDAAGSTGPNTPSDRTAY